MWPSATWHLLLFCWVLPVIMLFTCQITGLSDRYDVYTDRTIVLVMINWKKVFFIFVFILSLTLLYFNVAMTNDNIPTDKEVLELQKSSRVHNTDNCTAK